MLESTVVLAALGVVATIAGALVWLLKKLFTQNDDTIKQNTSATIELSKSINRLSEASLKQSSALEHQERATQEWQNYVITRFDNIENNTLKLLGSGEAKVQVIEHKVINKKGE